MGRVSAAVRRHNRLRSKARALTPPSRLLLRTLGPRRTPSASGQPQMHLQRSAVPQLDSRGCHRWPPGHLGSSLERLLAPRQAVGLCHLGPTAAPYNTRHSTWQRIMVGAHGARLVQTPGRRPRLTRQHQHIPAETQHSRQARGTKQHVGSMPAMQLGLLIMLLGPRHHVQQALLITKAATRQSGESADELEMQQEAAKPATATGAETTTGTKRLMLEAAGAAFRPTSVTSTLYL